MAESTKVRLVRCPKCENLLPELADYSVYQCGGCGAVLRAKNKYGHGGDSFSEKSDEERFGGVSAKLQNNSLEKGTADLSDDASDTDAKSNTGSLSCDKKSSEKDDVEYAERCNDQPKIGGDKWVVEDDLDMNMPRDELGNVMGRAPGDLSSQAGYTFGSWRSGRMSSWQNGERGEMDGFQRILKADVEGVRFSTSNYPDEGPSNYHSDSSYNFGETLRSHDEMDEVSRVQYLEQDRAELLRKLDELKDQLARSCNMVDKPKEKAPLDARRIPSDSHGGSDSWFPGGSSRPDRASMQFFGPDKHVLGPPYVHKFPEPFPHTNGHEMAMHGFHPSTHKSHHIPGYGDPFGPQMLGRAPCSFPGQYQQQAARPYFSGQYVDTNPDPFEPYPHNATFHHSSCSCYHCYEKHPHVSAPVPPTAFRHKQFPDIPSNPMLYHHENTVAFGSNVYKSRATVPSLNFCGPHSHTRWPSDLNAEMGGFVRGRPQRVVVASSGRRCRPIAGGAPFLTCYNCFELLQLPRKVLHTEKNQQKIRCGACSTVINYTVIDEKLNLSVNSETKQIPAEADDSSNELMQGSTLLSHGHLNQISANFSSDDYDNSGYDFQSIDRETVPLSVGLGLNSSKPQEMQTFPSSSLSTSEAEDSPTREVINSVQQPIKDNLASPPAGSPLQEHFDYSSNGHAVNRFGKGNRSSRSDQEKKIANKVTTRQNSLKEASLPTEMEVSFNEYSNTGMSQDSGDASREDDQARSSKGGESFFANIIKKSFRDLSRSNQTDERSKSNVSVNGHLITDRLVKKAEKLAGPIHPGQYWYDFRAGFWGVMGGSCLGIIPPFIEEFNYPIPANCAGGNTGVFVNGRELHQKDLDLLASRGLPIDRDRSYIIEISGRVLDEDTGEELDSLGKLAPTVEKVRHGFGMRIPKAAA